MRTEATARHTAAEDAHDARPASGRRMKAAPVAAKDELGLSLTDALEHILDSEEHAQRSA